MDIRKYTKHEIIQELCGFSKSSLRTRLNDPTKWELSEITKVVDFLENIKKPV